MPGSFLCAGNQVLSGLSHLSDTQEAVLGVWGGQGRREPCVPRGAVEGQPRERGVRCRSFSVVGGGGWGGIRGGDEAEAVVFLKLDAQETVRQAFY